MKSWFGMLLTAALLLGAGAATAAGYWRDLHAATQGQPDRYDRGQPQRQRGYGRDDRPQRQDPQRPQRLSDEERRELHRDLDKARRELYRPRRDR